MLVRPLLFLYAHVDGFDDGCSGLNIMRHARIVPKRVKEAIYFKEDTWLPRCKLRCDEDRFCEVLHGHLDWYQKLRPTTKKEFEVLLHTDYVNGR